MAIEANDDDSVVGGVVSTDDQVGQRAAGTAGSGAVGASANRDRGTRAGG
jgi:hypothetical protein